MPYMDIVVTWWCALFNSVTHLALLKKTSCNYTKTLDVPTANAKIAQVLVCLIFLKMQIDVKDGRDL